MQNYTTIIGIIELRLQKIGYETTQKRYGVGSSTVTLVMKLNHGYTRFDCIRGSIIIV